MSMTIGLFVLVFLIGVGVGTWLTLTFGKKNDSVVSPPAKGKWDKEKLNPFNFNETQMPTVKEFVQITKQDNYSFEYETKSDGKKKVIIDGNTITLILERLVLDNHIGFRAFGLTELKLMERKIVNGKEELFDLPTSLPDDNSPAKPPKNENAGESLEKYYDVGKTINLNPFDLGDDFEQNLKKQAHSVTTMMGGVEVTVSNKDEEGKVYYEVFYSDYLGNKDKHLKCSPKIKRQRSNGKDVAKTVTTVSQSIFSATWGLLTTKDYGFFVVLNYNQGTNNLVKRFDRQPDYDVYKWGLTEIWHSDIMVTAIYQDLLVLSEA